MSEDKNSWDIVPSAYGRAIFETLSSTSKTEKLDVDFSHGARLLSSLTGSARKYAETSSLPKFIARRATTQDTREGNDRRDGALDIVTRTGHGDGRGHEERSIPGVLL